MAIRERSFGILMRIFIFIQCLKKGKATIRSLAFDLMSISYISLPQMY